MGGRGARIRAAAAAVVLAGLGPAALEGRPQAGPTAVPSAGQVPLTVSFSPNDPGGAYYQWQFDRRPGAPFAPDYSSETAEPVTFTYGAPGSFTAVLRVHGLDGSLHEHLFAIQVLPDAPPPTVTLSPPHAVLNAGDGLTFTASASPSPGSAITTYLWDFDGDGQPEESSPPGPTASIHRSFMDAGVFVVTVTAVDDRGLSGRASAVVEVTRAPHLVFPPVYPAIAVAGEPLPLDATATAFPPATIAGWQWESGGDIVSTAPPPTSLTFTAIGLTSVRVTVTDSLGRSAFQTQRLTVVARPYLHVEPDGGDLRAWAFPPAGRTVTRYEWDLEDDGTVDYILPGGPTSAVKANPTRARVTAFLNSGSPMTVLWIRPAPGSSKGTLPQAQPVYVTVRATVGGAVHEATSTASPPPIPLRVGHVVPFVASAAVAGSGHTLTNLFWDFEGDGLRDQTDGLSSLNFKTVTEVPAEFQFQTVGIFSVVVKAFEDEGGVGQAVLTFHVQPGASPLETWISQPRPGQRVWGNRVSVQARATPAGRVGRVDFEARPAGGGSWKPIGRAVPPPYTSLGVAWDVTRLAPGDYDLRAIATSVDGLETADSEALRPVRVTVDPAAPEVSEFAADGASPVVRIHTIDPAASSRTEIAADTAIEFPPGAFGGRATVRMERPTSNPHPLEARQQNLHFVPGSFRRLHLVGQTLDRPSRIALYDLNPDGVLDTLAVDKTRLRVFQFDDVLRQWVPLFSQVVQPNEDLVRATFVSMGDVGLVVDRASPDGAAGSSGGCGSLGAELFLVLLAVRRRRPSRSA